MREQGPKMSQSQGRGRRLFARSARANNEVNGNHRTVDRFVEALEDTAFDFIVEGRNLVALNRKRSETHRTHSPC